MAGTLPRYLRHAKIQGRALLPLGGNSMLTEEGKKLLEARRRIKEILDWHHAMIEPAMQKLRDAGLAPLEVYEAEPRIEPKRRMHPDTKRRRAEVRDLWEAGLTDAEIAKRVSASVSTVKRDRKALGLRQKK